MTIRFDAMINLIEGLGGRFQTPDGSHGTLYLKSNTLPEKEIVIKIVNPHGKKGHCFTFSRRTYEGRI